MELKAIFVSPGEVRGRITAPPSKSLSQRAVFAAMLANGLSTIKNVSFCDDSLVALKLAEAFGAQVQRHSDSVSVQGGKEPKSRLLNFGESGFCLRCSIPIAAWYGGLFELVREGNLSSRSLGVSDAELLKLGIHLESGNTVELSGKLQAGTIDLDSSQSSQFLSGLLFALPLCETDSEIRVKNLVSHPYISLTLQALKAFGVSWEVEGYFTNFSTVGGQKYSACQYEIDGDWSAASFFLVAGAIAGKVEVDNLSFDSLQADRAVLQALEAAGAKVSNDSKSVTVEKNKLEAFHFDATHCPDLMPPLVTLACFCNGVTRLKGVKRLLNKESNRAEALRQEFLKLGAHIELNDDEIEVKGTRLKGGQVESHGDHRIAMACAVAGLNTKDGISIADPHCVSKSCPDFFTKFEELSPTFMSATMAAATK